MSIATQPLLNSKQAAALLGLTNPNTMAVWRARRQGPIYIKMGKLVKYREEDLERFIDANTVTL